VRNIEKLGVKMAIVMDDRDEDSEHLVMADDNTGHSIHIPSFIIRKSAGQYIKDTLLRDKPPSVYVSAEMLMDNPDNRVEYELWYSSILDIEYHKLMNIGIY
jgi:hypothetical protein